MALTEEQKAQAAQFGRRLDRGSTQQQEDDGPWQSEGALGDTAVGLAAGALELPGMATGLADIPAGLAGFDRPFSRSASALGDLTGISPSETADTLREERYSPQMQESQQAVQESWDDVGEAWEEGDTAGAVAEGFGAVGSYLQNPRAIQSLVTESLPSTAAGGLIGRGLQAAAGTTTGVANLASQGSRLTPAASGAATQGAGRTVATGQAARQAATRGQETTNRLSGAWAGAAGQAPIMGGAAMNEIDDDVDPQRAALAALGIGIGGAAIAGAGAQAASRAGLTDIDTALANRSLSQGVSQNNRGVLSRVGGGAVSEGVLQEMPQESLNRLAQNWAEGEPLLANLPRAAVEGMLAGGVLGGTTNVLPNRSRQPDGDLTRQGPTEQEAIDSDEPVEPNGPMNVEGADTSSLLRYHRRLTKVANEADQFPDLQDEAIRRIDGVLSEFDRQNIPREVVDLELAKGRYTEAQLERDQMQKQYRDALRTDPSRAQNYLNKARQRSQEIQSLESTYGSEALQTPDLGTIQTLQQREDAAPYFRQRNGERTNRLKASAQQRLQEYREQPENELVQSIVRDREDVENGFEPDRWTPLREVVAQERGIDVEAVESVEETSSQDNAVPTENAESETERRYDSSGFDQFGFDREGQGVPLPNPPDSVDVLQRDMVRPADQETSDQQSDVAQGLEYMRDSLTPTQRNTWDSMLDAVQNAQAGDTASSLIDRAAENRGVSRQAIESSFRRMIRGIGRATGRTELNEMSPQRFMDSLLQPSEQSIAESDAPTQPEQPTTDLDDVTAGDVDSGDPALSFLGTDQGATIDSVGGSQSNVRATFDRNSTRIAELREERTGASQERAAQIDSQIEALRRQNQEYIDASREFGDVDASPEQSFQESLQESTDFQRRRQAREQASAQAEQQATQERLNTFFSQPDVQQMGVAWDKRANRFMSDADRVTWDNLVETNPEIAIQWVQSVQSTLRNTDASDTAGRRERLRELFNMFTGAQDGQAQNTGESGQGNQATTGQPEPVIGPDGERSPAGAAQASGVNGEAGSETSTVEQDVREAAAETDLNPSEAQAEAGNYRKGRVRVNGFQISIENPRGSVRRGTAPDGTPWESEMQNHYGDIKGTTAADGDNLDVFLGENLASDRVYVIDQINEDGSFDEHKVMMGFDNADQASAAYLANYDEGWTGLGAVTEMPLSAFRPWARDGDKSLPMSDDITSEQETVSQQMLDRFNEAMRGMAAMGRDMADPDGSMTAAFTALRDAAPETTGGEVTSEMTTALNRVEQILADESGPVAQSTESTGATAPTIRRRGRRRYTPEQLNPPQAATAEAIDEAATAASDPQAGPEARRRLSELQQAEAYADMAQRGTPDPITVAESVGGVLDVVTGTSTTADQALDAVQAVISDTNQLSPVIDALRGHASLRNVRFLDTPLSDADTALGHYYGDVHAIYINADKFDDAVANIIGNFENSSNRPDLEVAETVVHELVHAASLRYLADNPDAPETAELNAVAQEIVEYVNNNRSEFSDREMGVLQEMLSDRAEMVTYALTNPVAQKALERVPSRQSPSNARGMWGRIVDAITSLLGLSPNQGTAIDVLLRSATSIVHSDARQTDRAIKSLNDSGSLWGADMGQVTDNLRMLEEGNWDTQGYTDAFMEYMNAADTARMEGNAEAEVTALDGLKRTVDSIAMRAAEVRDVSGEGRIEPLARRDGTDNLSDRIYSAALDKAPPAMSNWLTGLKNSIRRLGYLSMFSHDFVDNVRQHLPQVESYFNTIFNRISERNNQHVAIQKIVDPVSQFTQSQRDALNTFLRESTYKEAWGFQPSWINTQVSVDPQLRRMYDKLPDASKKVAREMFQYAQQSNQQIQNQLRNDIITTYDSYIDKATRPNEIAKRQREKQTALRDHDNRQINFKAAYLPLKRWGEWAIVHKSSRFKAAERMGNKAQVETLKSDPNHYRVAFAESEFQARQERDRMAEELGTPVADPFQRMRYEEANEAVPFDLMQRLRTEAIGDNSDAPSRSISSAIDKLYIEALSESSVRKSELRRLKVEGAGKDMVRAFVEHGQGLASLSSALKINKETRRAIAEMKKHATDPRAGKNRNARMQALNEVLARHATSLDTDNQYNWQQRAMGYTSIWMLLSSPAYYIQNATQPFMLTYPVLAAKFGTNKSLGYMRRAYSDVFTAQRSTADGNLMDPAKLKDPQESALFDRLQRLGLLDVGIAADLGGLREGKTTLGRGFHAAHRKMLTAVRTVEVYNRGVTAISSYRLNKQQLEADREAGRNQMSDSAIIEQSKQYALKAIQTTQGDYSGPNAPRLISMLPAGRLLTQFRKFQLIQIGLLTRTFHQAFKGANKAERAIGRRQMAYILGMHGMVGGAMGLPAANILGYALAKAMGDEEEPKNAELLARRAIGNKEVADLILRGIPASLGVDASTRLGMGLTFSLMPFADVSASRDGAMTAAFNLLGPTAGLGAQFADGVGQMQQGNVAMGMTQLMPSLLKNVTKAYLYKTDGVRMRNGDEALSADELSWFSTATQGLGWPGTQITDRYFAADALRGTQEHFRSQTTKIKRAYTSAWDDGDRQSMQEAREAWRRLQDMRREYNVGNPQSLSILTKAPMDQRERERLMVRGVSTQNTTKRFVEELFE